MDQPTYVEWYDSSSRYPEIIRVARLEKHAVYLASDDGLWRSSHVVVQAQSGAKLRVCAAISIRYKSAR